MAAEEKRKQKEQLKIIKQQVGLYIGIVYLNYFEADFEAMYIYYYI